MKKLIKKWFLPAALLVVGAVAVLWGSGSALTGCGKSEIVVEDLEAAEETDSEEAEVDPVPETVTVHVCGAVVSPGVYEFTGSERYQDAINAAGGFTDDANRDYLNLAQLLTDGEQIYVPSQNEEVLPEAESNDGKVNINTADLAEFMTLPGIGETKAQSIVKYRDEHGSFASIEELKSVPGIKDATFLKIEDKIKI